jgi:phage gp16-like protein
MSIKQPLAERSRSPVDNRQHYYTLLALGKAQLEWDDQFYYGIWLPMQGATKKDGRYSATTLSIGQLAQAVQVMKGLGFKVKPKRKLTHDMPDFRTPRIAKLNALWLAMAEAGVVTDKSQVALEAWCKRYTKKDRLQWAGSNELNTCIEMLKQWASREHVPLD